MKKVRSLLGFTPANMGLFKRVFLHKSTTNNTDDNTTQIQSNERLEYLGDAVLGTIVAEYLFIRYPKKDEGFLTKMRSKIVKRKTLNQIADSMGLQYFLESINENSNHISRSMLGNALEALVGAIYIEQGYAKTKGYVIKILKQHIDIVALENYDDNYKSQLLEWCQKNDKIVRYEVVQKYKGQNNRDKFKIAVIVDDEKQAEADDFNKKAAQQTASERALLKLGILQED